MRKALERGFWVACGACAVVAVGLFVAIAGVVLWRGAGVLSWSFLTSPTADAGASGGVLHQLVGTAVLVGTGLALALPLAVGLALWLEHTLPPRLARRARLGLYLWNGVPSIVFGLLGLALLSDGLGLGKSWLAGGLVLGLMIVPTVTVAVAERMAAVPRRDLEAAAALGLSRARVATAVLLPQSRSGLASGALLGLARAAGETAPILFTAAVFSGAGWPTGFRESPVLALPYHIFVLAQDTLDAAAGERLWGAAAVLVALVAAFSLLALPARLAAHEEARRD